jgi:WS/DGAT/MGAT family acyltransferase
VAWNEPLPLEEVKAVGYALGASVNDVLLSCVAGAIRGYLADRGEFTDGIELRAMVPVNLRGPRSKGLGNKFGLVPLLLPVGMDNPIARVHEVRARMEQLKHGYTAVLAMGLLGVMGVAPRAVQKQITDILASKATAVMTNVPGPREPLYMAGAQIRRMMFWVPQSGDIAVGVSILSYSGGVQFGLITDKRVCREPQAIIDRFAAEFEKLVSALLLLPWGEPVSAEAAEEWLFPVLEAAAPPTDDEAPLPRRAPPAKRAAKRAAAPAKSGAKPAAQPAKQAAASPRPAGIARKRSAFAAARES